MKKICLAALISIGAVGYAEEDSGLQTQVDVAPTAKIEVAMGEKNLQGCADGKMFLDPYINSELKQLSGKSLLDVGCQTAEWAIVAAQNGATVCGVDVKKGIVEKAQAAIAKAGVEARVSLFEGTCEKLPFDSKSFDTAISLNIGCSLPKTMHTASQDIFEVSGLDAHFKELARVLKEGGRVLVTAPASLGVVFTYGGCNESDVNRHIEEVLAKIGDSEDEEKITSCLEELNEVLRATFVRREGKLVLVTDEKQLSLGEQIWRKVPEGVVPNYYHSEEEYLVGFKNAGLTCEEIKRPCFQGTVKYHEHRSSVKGDERPLGAAYAENHPFTIYYVTKKA